MTDKRKPFLEYGTNIGHGHVWARPDGIKARCGGPTLCSECARWQARLTPINPNEGASPAVDASGDPDARNTFDKDRDGQTITPQPDARHELAMLKDEYAALEMLWQDRGKENAALREALMPFALFHSAVARRFDLDKFSVSVVTIEHQSLSVGAFIAADAALKETGDE